MYKYFIILAIIILVLISKAYIKITSPFWSTMPVYHTYNWMYWFGGPREIEPTPPEKDRWCNDKDIIVKKFVDITPEETDMVVKFIKDYYLNNKEITYNPDKSNIIPYFIGHSGPCYCSIYWSSNFTDDHTNDEITLKKEPIGILTSRPLNIVLNKYNKKLYVHYADYLCIHPHHRKQNLSPELIQTQTYTKRNASKDMQVCFFKRENNPSMFIKHLIQCDVYSFDIKKWNRMIQIPTNFKFLEITKNNIHIFDDHLSKNMKKFECVVYPDLGNILELIKTGNLYIFVLVETTEIIATYIYRNGTCVSDKRKVVELIGSINNTSNPYYFILGAKETAIALNRRDNFEELIIEDVSDNNVIIFNILLSHNYIFKSSTSYYFYNYISESYNPNKCLVII